MIGQAARPVDPRAAWPIGSVCWPRFARRGPPCARTQRERGPNSVAHSGPKRIHLIGVCGTAMATLAALLKSRGHDVRGSDQNVYPPMSDFLAAEQIRTFSGYDAAHIATDVDLVVVGNAISRGNVELEAV